MKNCGMVAVSTMLLCALFACAGIDYKKVPTPTQYDTWSDERQAEADAMDGVRYYLPRPFLHLKQSVPVAQRVAFFSVVYAEETKDGKTRKGYRVEMPADAPTWVQRALPEWLSVTQVLAATLSSPADDAAEQQSGNVEGGAKPEEAAPSAPPSTLKASTGFINATDPVTKLSDRMDVVYLPDFEEQYVIQPSSGMGKADVETRLRNGWAAEVFTQSVDNSNLIPYVIEQVEKASEAAAGIATTWGLKAVAGVAPAELKAIKDIGAAEQQSGAVGDSAVKMLGQTLLFKIAEVRTAQPGLYPILKPREIQQWLKYQGVVNGDPQAAFETYLQQSQTPWIRPDMAFIPCPPFTMVGFNVTTDVFLTSATDKLDIGTAKGGGGDNPGKGGDNQAEQAALDKIKAALFAARVNSKLPEISGLKDQNITVKAAGEETHVKLKNPLSFGKAQATEYRKWVREALEIPDSVDAGKDPKFDDGATTITIIVPTSASNIDKVLGN